MASVPAQKKSNLKPLYLNYNFCWVKQEFVEKFWHFFSRLLFISCTFLPSTVSLLKYVTKAVTNNRHREGRMISLSTLRQLFVSAFVTYLKSI